MKPKSVEIDWNSRFSVQAAWTRPLREFLINQIGIGKSSRILEIGSGTGVILRETNDQLGSQAIGIDFALNRLVENKKIETEQVISCANVYDLPFLESTFDYVISHYFFLWLQNPIRALHEVKRVLRTNGSLLVFAEPDYSSRVEYPEEFHKIGSLQTRSLSRQGINPSAGRMLPENLTLAGFKDVQFGLPGFQHFIRQYPPDLDSEWQMLEFDLENEINPKELEQYKKKDKESRLSGSRVSWMPTFYAIGRKN